AGTATHLGEWTSSGEIRFEAGPRPGSLVGTGVVAFQAANGERLVASLTVEAASDGVATYRLRWRESITLTDRTRVGATGRFLDPPFSGVGGVGNFRVTRAVDNQLISSFLL